MFLVGELVCNVDKGFTPFERTLRSVFVHKHYPFLALEEGVVVLPNPSIPDFVIGNIV